MYEINRQTPYIEVAYKFSWSPSAVPSLFTLPSHTLSQTVHIEMQILGRLGIWYLLTQHHVLSALLFPKDVALQCRFNVASKPEAPDEKGNDAPQKYFHESASHGHYDSRFGKRPLLYEDHRRHLSTLMRAYLSITNDIGVETWLMHGSLLGWY
jgi:hypothetical protein